jgi:hypothetical protein
VKKVIIFIFLCLPLFAQEMDRNVTSFERREKKRIDLFDFSGDWPNMEDIDIDATRKKRVEVDLTGNYPLLERINFEGGFGLLRGQVTGNFPKLTLINFLCGSSAMTLDFTAKWIQSCEINIRGAREDVTLVLPSDVGLIVSTKVGPRGRVRVEEGLKKKGFGLLKKNYQNTLASTAEIVLQINIETSEGDIILRTVETVENDE